MRVAVILTDTLRIASGRKLAVMIGKDIEEFPENSDRLTGTIDIWWIVRILMIVAFWTCIRSSVWWLKITEMLECILTVICFELLQ